ncbi:glycosyltransferase [Nocardioides sp.]|uniref:glycosyltransferase n=1 Tax=Nocardioides sp. TaxID=35761 RepID=UPI002C4C5845|nr:glycosyltransferase [Nocardioides sp.]HXH77588.1 glycosyltransferase [Nocardioides sp.]
MRVLISSTPGYGHIFPMFPLARALSRAGHEVLWATSRDAAQPIRQRGIDVVHAGLSGDALHGGMSAVKTAALDVPPPQRAAYVYPRMFGRLLTPPMASDLLPLARDWRPDVMVHEHAELGSPLVGGVLGIPTVTHAFGGAIPSAILDSASEMVAPTWREHGLAVPPYAGCFGSLYLDICPSSVQSVPVGHIPQVQALRPVAEPAPCDAGLPECVAKDARPLVYVTLGTVQNHSPVLPRVVDALASLDVRVLVTVGPDGDPASLGEQPAHVRVETWVDQTHVFQHCSVVVSHAGSGTFLGALAAGLPQVCLPLAADQFRNAEGGLRAGAAVVIAPGQFSQAGVADAVVCLLTDDSFRDAARNVAAEIQRMPAAAEAVQVLARLVT